MLWFCPSPLPPRGHGHVARRTFFRPFFSCATVLRSVKRFTFSRIVCFAERVSILFVDPARLLEPFSPISSSTPFCSPPFMCIHRKSSSWKNSSINRTLDFRSAREECRVRNAFFSSAERFRPYQDDNASIVSGNHKTYGVTHTLTHILLHTFSHKQKRWKARLPLVCVLFRVKHLMRRCIKLYHTNNLPVTCACLCVHRMTESAFHYLFFARMRAEFDKLATECQ